ncbi:hypothetical protein RV12_GL002255 [Enterococcus quebecensis]|nr:hypothetical protein RV12_GL002255 [Enterococcus quebecensis]
MLQIKILITKIERTFSKGYKTNNLEEEISTGLKLPEQERKIEVP